MSQLLQHCYRAFQQNLQQLSRMATQANPDTIALRSTFLEIQQFFQTQMMQLDTEELPEVMQSKVRTYQTEINKQLRLLGMDVMFLQAARQSITTQQRQAQMIDRIETLLRYCRAVLGE